MNMSTNSQRCGSVQYRSTSGRAELFPGWDGERRGSCSSTFVGKTAPSGLESDGAIETFTSSHFGILSTPLSMEKNDHPASA
jgi:hypothetical protein